jgi:hypothetical protein
VALDYLHPWLLICVTSIAVAVAAATLLLLSFLFLLLLRAADRCLVS